MSTRTPRPLALAALAALGALATAAPSAGATVAATPILTLHGTAELAAGGAHYALTTRDDQGQLEVLVGEGTSAPVRAEGIGAGFLGPVHFGTAADGAAVITYPRCANGQRARCDLYAWDLATHRESAIAGVNGRSTAEVEGVMQRGVVAFTRESGGRRSLLLRSAAGRTRTLSRTGGEQLALSPRGEVLQVVEQTSPGRRLLLLQQISSSRRTRVLRREGVGENQQRLVAPAFVGGAVQVTLEAIPGSTPLRIAAGGRTTQARTGKVETDLSFVSPSRAYALRLDYRENADDPAITVVRLSGIAFRPVG